MLNGRLFIILRFFFLSFIFLCILVSRHICNEQIINVETTFHNTRSGVLKKCQTIVVDLCDKEPIGKRVFQGNISLLISGQYSFGQQTRDMHVDTYHSEERRVMVLYL